MKCIVRKLKATIDNAALPVFENVVLKNYITTTQDGQYMVLTEANVPQVNCLLEVVFQKPEDNSNYVAALTANNYISTANQYVRINNMDRGTNVSTQSNVDIRAGFNTHTGEYYVNDTTGVCTKLIQAEYSNPPYVFSRSSTSNSQAGKIRIRQVKVTNLATNEVFLFVPAEINGVAVLYDADRGVFYGEANGGTLLCG